MRQITLTFILSLLSICGFAQWQTLGDNIYYNIGNVGIGTEYPDVQLHLKNENSNALLRIESSSLQGGIQLISNGNYKPFINFGTDGEPGSKGGIYYDVNYNHLAFRGCKIFDETIEMVLQDNGNVGIGTKSPAFKLDLNGDLNLTGNIYKNGQLLNPSCLWLKNGDNIYYNSGRVGLGTENPDVQFHLKNENSNALLRIESSSLQGGIQLISNGNYKPFINFGTDGEAGSKGGIYYDVNYNQLAFRGCKIFDETKEMVLQDNGNVGIGTKTPSAKLEVAEGDIFISDITKGIIMKSPDGNCWRGQVDNIGNLSFTMIDCPLVAVYNKIETTVSQPSIAIFPNPTENFLTIIINEFRNQSVNAEIYNISGKLIFAKIYSSSTFNIDTSAFQNGTYILKLITSEGELLKTEKIIK